MMLIKNYFIYFFFIFLFNYTLYSQVTITSNNLKVDNNLVSNNTIAFNSNLSVNISIDIKMETTDGSTNTTFGNLFLYYKTNTDDTPTQIAIQSITFVNNYPKTNYINNTFFTSIKLFKNDFLSNGGTLYAEYKTNDKKVYKSQVINITGGGHTTMPPPPNNQSKQIFSNLIGNDQIIASGEIPKPFSYYTPFYRNSDNLPGRRGSASSGSSSANIYLTIFKWQIKTRSTNWTDIPGATSAGYSPNKAIYENTSYRRIAFYEGGQYDFSNNIFIIINDQSFQNTICCNQIITSSSSGKEEIAGNTPNLNNFTYRWQSCSDPSNIIQNWAEMPFANDKNFPPSYIQPSTGRGNETEAYRRLIKQNGNVISISNTVSITYSIPNTSTGPTRNDGTTPTRTSKSTTNNDFKTNPFISTNNLSDTTIIKENLDAQNIENKTNQESLKINNNISLYPNPITNYFNIEGAVNINDIAIYDFFGKKINIVKQQKSTNLIEINTTDLQSGIFILKIDNTTFSKTLIKN
ncbi:hypothetical protein BD847_2865 [Flavobacterium cutihirudinis]|uniref:Secretion system C-terminal sorting domain-containing protein n=2 Tax=Flavobacterium cutihirudinis TaxID=1265740 RepID=A0A3D9FT95_9FLAO|nr:hypothetical protein BD847_2865 [Flavobacterium cutihirudinis]